MTDTENALLEAHRNALGEKPCRTRGIHACREVVEGVFTVFSEDWANGQPWKSAEVAPPEWGVFPLLMSLIKGLACLRVAKEKVDDCTAATRASR